MNKKLILILILIDQVCKFISRNILEEIVIIKNFFSLRFVKNYGISFSLLSSKTFLIILISFISIIYIYYLLKKNSLLKLNFSSLILAGAFSNLLDRVFFGYVVDMFDLKNFFIFNLADVFIFFGFITLIYRSFKNEIR